MAIYMKLYTYKYAYITSEKVSNNSEGHRNMQARNYSKRQKTNKLGNRPKSLMLFLE